MTIKKAIILQLSQVTLKTFITEFRLFNFFSLPVHSSALTNFEWSEITSNIRWQWQCVYCPLASEECNVFVVCYAMSNMKNGKSLPSVKRSSLTFMFWKMPWRKIFLAKKENFKEFVRTSLSLTSLKLDEFFKLSYCVNGSSFCYENQ